MKKSCKPLRAVEAKSADAGKGLARIDPAPMENLQMNEGEVFLIEG